MKDLEELTREDWGSRWDELPTADDLQLKPAPSSAQLTLRIGLDALDTLRREARASGTPYHVLARQWILDGLRSHLALPSDDAALLDAAALADRQINIKLEASALARIKKAAHDRRIPYHRLARLWITAGLERAASTRSANPVVHRRPRLSMSDLVLLFLDRRSTTNRSNGAVDDRIRLQKLLFLVTQRAGIDLRNRFYAYHFGPFSDEVDDAVGALSDKGLVSTNQGGEPTAASVADMLAVLDRRRAGKASAKGATYRQTDAGATAVSKLLELNPDARELLPVIQAVRAENDGLTTDEIIERVYEEFPAVTGRSLIRAEVTARRTARRAPRR